MDQKEPPKLGRSPSLDLGYCLGTVLLHPDPASKIKTRMRKAPIVIERSIRILSHLGSHNEKVEEHDSGNQEQEAPDAAPETPPA